MISVRRPAPVVGDRWLVGLLLVLTLGVIAAYLALRVGQQGGMLPGDTTGHLFGITGAILMAVGLFYPLVKRTTPLASLKSWWHQGHLLLGAAGVATAAVHVSGRIEKAPALVALAVLGLLVLGAYGRLLASRLAYTTFASDPLAFLPANPSEVEPFLPLVKQKGLLVARLEPGARENTFSLALRHWVRHPILSARFIRLALQEEWLVGKKRAGAGGLIVLLQRNWRLFHLVLVTLMGVGLLTHVIVVLFFAGYVAEGGEVYWWHFRQ